MYNIGYKDTDKKLEIEIYGILFELPRITEELDRELKRIVKEEETMEGLQKGLNLLLGEGAVDKLNAQRIKDGYKELDVMNYVYLIGETSKLLGREVVKVKNGYKDDIREYDRKPYRKPYRNNYRR